VDEEDSDESREWDTTSHFGRDTLTVTVGAAAGKLPGADRADLLNPAPGEQLTPLPLPIGTCTSRGVEISAYRYTKVIKASMMPSTHGGGREMTDLVSAVGQGAFGQAVNIPG
jgi:hypothetical protein